jgi:hypothetical protein
MHGEHLVFKPESACPFTSRESSAPSRKPAPRWKAWWLSRHVSGGPVQALTWPAFLFRLRAHGSGSKAAIRVQAEALVS